MGKTFAILFSLALIIGGIVASIVSYQSADPGQTRYIYWGMVVAGLFGLVKALVSKDSSGKCYVAQDSSGNQVPVVMVPIKKVLERIGSDYQETLIHPDQQRTLADVIYQDLRSHEDDWQSLAPAWEPVNWQSVEIMTDQKGRPRYLAITFDVGLIMEPSAL